MSLALLISSLSSAFDQLFECFLWDLLGPFGGHLVFLEALGLILETLRANLGALGIILEALVAILGPSWGVLGPSWGRLGPSWEHRRSPWDILGRSEGGPRAQSLENPRFL